LSYPRFDDRGEENLPSLYLDHFPIAPAGSQAVLPRTTFLPAAALPAGMIGDGLLREVVAQKHRKMRVTAMESYAQCPFQFFGRHTLELEEPPPRPDARLDARVQGTIVHRAVAEWLRAPQPIGPLFDRLFEESCAKERIPPGYRTEWLRTQMRADLERFAAFPERPPGAGTCAELPFEFDVTETLAIRGRIDRLDRGPDGKADVVDYKYSKRAGEYARNENLLQGPLYLMAVEKALGLQAGTMSYCGLRGAVQYVEQAMTRERLQESLDTAVRIAREIGEGNAVAQPVDLDKCRYCTFKDVCRYRAEAAAAAGEGA
jgi:ATP-dependent helicase/DNAse subunit B